MHGVVVRESDLQPIGRRFESGHSASRTTLGKLFTHTHVPLSPSSINWYRHWLWAQWPGKGRWAPRLRSTPVLRHLYLLFECSPINHWRWYLTNMLRFWPALGLPVLIICSRRSWIFASNCSNSARHQRQEKLIVLLLVSVFVHYMLNMGVKVNLAYKTKCSYTLKSWLKVFSKIPTFKPLSYFLKVFSKLPTFKPLSYF